VIRFALSLFFYERLQKNAEQLTSLQRWQLILASFPSRPPVTLAATPCLSLT
jgi:hypothetical protein